MQWLASKSLADRIIHLCSRLAFRGIYFPQMTWRHWLQLVFQNRATIFQVISDALKRKFRLVRPAPEERIPVRALEGVRGLDSAD